MTAEGAIPITPDTKVAALLDAYPELEPVLIEAAPAFRKLRNPVLRKTVAKVATLERAAGMAGLEPAALVRTLRKAVGQPVEDRDTAIAAVEPDAPGDVAWFDEARVTETIDADTMLAAGKVPLGAVLRAASELSAGDILRVTVEFKPVPLVETLQQQGFATHCRKVDGGPYELFVCRT